MNSFELNCSWHFAKQQDASQDVGPNNAANEHFIATPYPSLIRESIQNSLDVVDDKSQPLRMKFQFGRLRSKSYEAFYGLRSHIEGVLSLYHEKAEPEYSQMLKRFDVQYDNQQTLDYIKVSDYNTKGMDYKPNDSPFHAFVRAVGLTVKEDAGSGGSFGFGKAAYFLMSPIHTILVSTKTKEGKTFFEGAASLCTHMLQDETGELVKYQHYGFYDNQDGKQPASSNEHIPSKFQREENGTDIYIMGVDGSNERRKEAYEEMVQAVLRNFWLAIMDNKLVVEIGETCISADTLDELMCKHFSEMIDKSKSSDRYNPRPYYEAVKNANTSSNHILIQKELPLLGNVSLYIWKCKDAKDIVIYMRKQRMLIERTRTNTTNYGYYAVFLCTDTNGNELLKSIEDPSHKKWDNRRNKAVGDITGEIKDFIDNYIQEAFSNNSGGPLGIIGLEDYLFVPKELVGSSREDVKDNPFFGAPSDDDLDDGISPTTTIDDPTSKNNPKIESSGKVVIITKTRGERDPNGNKGGHQRELQKKKHKGSGNTPDSTRYKTSDLGNDGNYFTKIPITYRVIAESKEGEIIHTIILHPEQDAMNGKIEIVVCGEEKDEVLNIVKTSVGRIEGNSISNLELIANKKTIIELKFADNMKHALKLVAYEFQ